MIRDFTILGFVEHLAVLGAEIAHAEVEGLDRAAELIETEAKAAFGIYQDQAGPFAAWDELAEATKADRVRQGYPEDEPELRSGATRDSIERTVVAHAKEAEIGSDSEILEWQELGTKHMPPRSILGGAAVRCADRVATILGDRYYGALVGQQVFQSRLRIR